MFRQMLIRAGAPAMVAAVLLTAGPAWAQHGSGGHGGGFHGGFRGGGFHGGGFHSERFHDGRFHRGGYYPGYYYGYYPSDGYDSSYGYPPDSSYPSYDVEHGLPPVSPDSAATAQPDSTAHVTVRVPANAELWFDGSPTTLTGPIREFQSPPLTPGQYTYEIRARWTENGHDVTQAQKVTVSPGAHRTAVFPIGSGTDRDTGAPTS
jgi:uncharacterized protein (TIGR03000 family)